jgi:hypothetical protein
VPPAPTERGGYSCFASVSIYEMQVSLSRCQQVFSLKLNSPCAQLPKILEFALFGRRIFRLKNHLNLEDRLAILQVADPRRKWYSLDHHRVCVLCNKLTPGGQIVIRSDGRGRHHLSCPTEGCPSTIRAWLYDGNGCHHRPWVKGTSRQAEADCLSLRRIVLSRSNNTEASP